VKPECISPQIAGGTVFRQQAVRAHFVEIFGDGERVPHLDAVVREARHEDRRGEEQELLACVRVVGRDHDHFEFEAGEFREQPPAQGPR
jgi:hypothetical protein